MLLASSLMAALSAFGQIPDGTPKFDKPPGRGPAADPSAQIGSEANSSLTFFRRYFNTAGTVQLPFQFVGTDPAAGAATSIIPTVIIPMRFTFPDAGNPVLDGNNVAMTVMNSPIFQMTDYTVGGVDLGVTQYGDAIQRAEFWNYPGFSQSGYHVLLGTPTVTAPMAVTVPGTGCGADGTASCGTAVLNSRGTLVGRLDYDYFTSLLTTLHTAYSASVLPIFLTDNVVLYQGDPSNCCIVGYHDAESGSPTVTRTWIYASYVEFNTFSQNSFSDVTALSHEVAEWLNDPFVGTFGLGALNFVSPYVLPGQGGACQLNFETGDVLESGPSVFTKTIGTTTYTLQDEAFLPYFLHGPASFSINGWYTFMNTFTTPAALCGPG